MVFLKVSKKPLSKLSHHITGGNEYSQMNVIFNSFIHLHLTIGQSKQIWKVKFKLALIIMVTVSY